METFSSFLDSVSAVVWGPPMLVLILGVGLLLNVMLKAMPLFRLGYGFRMVWQARKPGGPGEITPFAALMTALAATVGTGNIAGVATAIALGGPGAMFWMWCTALVGMATKYSEVLLAVHYREKDSSGEYVGGPMYAIRNGLGPKWAVLGGAFALFGGLAGFGIGNMVQANTVAHAAETTFNIPTWISALALMVLTGLVVVGGIRRIGAVAQALVPAMCVIYVLGALFVLFYYAAEIPGAFALIFTHAFTPTAATGGFAGAAVWAAMRYGVARGVFSNEAGLGTAGIAQAAGMSSSPVRSGVIGMMGTFIDTIIICSMTGLAIIASGAWTSGLTGAALSTEAVATALPTTGGVVVTLALAVFAFTTILGWSYFGEKCWTYLVGAKCKMPFRVLWTLAVPIGAMAQLDLVWLIADVLNAFMAIPNLISLVALSPVIVKLTRDYFAQDSHDELVPEQR
ncbi:sodium:alanine symporter family protein [Telmatospirillum sp. J64-1]|uniref:alanine/glycine:cation symporter family protein n=1 Tax=Telmatospirillum sp. J64-1 TaxID=2502183 RepID=UPI00115D717D|nr:sodium:alanine symporter family protein [Telmatospirillum sp. J64-1]